MLNTIHSERPDRCSGNMNTREGYIPLCDEDYKERENPSDYKEFIHEWYQYIAEYSD